MLIPDHFIYNGKLGFFSGTSLTILVTKIICNFNSTKMTIYQILAKFFDVFTYKRRNNLFVYINNLGNIKHRILSEFNKGFWDL